MANEYKFILDSLVVSEPIGWDNSKRILRRSDKFKYLFIEYITDLTFHSDGYDYILSILNANGFCASIELIIMYRCSDFDGYTRFFKGVIKVSDIEVDEEKCLIRCKAQDDTLQNILVERADTKVRLSATKTIKNTGLASILKSMRLHLTTTGAYTTTIQAYKAFDALSYILSYISNGQLTLTSNFFQTQVSTRNSHTIKFTNPTVDLVNTSPDPDLSIKWTNDFTQHNDNKVLKQATVASTLDRLCSRFNQNVTPASDNQKYYDQDMQWMPIATNNGTDTITLTNDLGFSIDKILFAAHTSASIKSIPNPNNGKKFLALTTGNQLRGNNTQVPELSFKELFDELDKLFGLGMSISSGGVCTIEPLEKFFSTTSAILVENIIGLKYRISREFSKDLVTTGDGSDGRDIFGDQTAKLDWVSFGDCSEEKLDISNKFIVDMDDIVNQTVSTDVTKDQNIFLIEGTTGGGGADIDSLKYKNTIYTNTAGTTSIDVYAYNAQLTNYWKITNWMFQLRGDMQNTDKIIQNTASPKLEKEYEFDCQLTKTQADSIVANKNQIVNFNKGTNIVNQKSGWVKEISIENKTGRTHMKLLTT